MNNIFHAQLGKSSLGVLAEDGAERSVGILFTKGVDDDSVMIQRSALDI